MANEEQLSILRQGVDVWHRWRKDNPFVEIDLLQAELPGADLRFVNLVGADLRGSDLRRANLTGSDLSESKLLGANLHEVDAQEVFLMDADLRGVNLRDANLRNSLLDGANLLKANLINADLRDLILVNLNLVRTKIHNAKISGCKVYGINVWDLEGEFSEQENLIVTADDEATITVDNVEIAQFIYLLLNNKKIRNAINTLTSKTVLILGRFAIPERKEILDSLRNKLREVRSFTNRI